MDYLAQATARIAIKSLQGRPAATDVAMRAGLAFVVIACFCTPLLAQTRSIYKPYRSVFEIRQHVDGSPLLIDGRFEFYLFPSLLPPYQLLFLSKIIFVKNTIVNNKNI